MQMPLRGAGIVVVVLLFCGGCGSTDESAPTTTLPTTQGSPPATTAASTMAPVSASTVTVTTTTTTTTAPSTTTTVPGEPIAGPLPGSRWGVVGVAHDDVLNVRADPGTSHAVVATLAPLAVGIEATGNGYQFDRSLWWEIEVDGGTGWVNAAFLAVPGAVDDATAETIARLDAIPKAASLEELGRLVAIVPSGGEPAPRVVVVAAPTVGDLGEITLDVVGIGDDAIYGERLHVFAFPPQNGVGFVLKSVERTVLCLRAATDDGLCV